MDLKPYERIDDLQLNGLRLIQNPHSFCFGIDAVLLSNFPVIKPGTDVLDLCTGSGIIPVLLSAKTRAGAIEGLEIDTETADMAKRSVSLNNLSSRIHITCGDVKDAPSIYKGRKFHTITCNPPYGNANSGLLSPNKQKAKARHELSCTLEDIMRACFPLLQFGGKLCMVHRAERIADIICSMRAYKIEPKRLCMVHPKEGKAPNLILIEGAMGGKPGIKHLPPIYVH